MALTRITKGVIKPNENYDTHNINSTGIVTAIGLDVNGNADISGSLSVGGVLTYEDVTSIDSVGIITAQKDIHVGAGVSAVGVGTFGSLDIGGDIDVDGHTNLDNVSVAGVSTFSDDIKIPVTNKKLIIGASGQLQLYNQGYHSRIDHVGNHWLTLRSNAIALQDASNNYYFDGRESSSSARLFFSNNPKLETTNTGINVTGNVVSDGADIDGDLDVDGHTNLDNVSVAGITTHNEDVRFITANGGNIFIDKSDNTIRLGESVGLFYGANKMWMQHNGSVGYLHNVTGSLYIRNEDSSGDIYIQGKSGEHSIICNYDGDVQLYYDGGIVAQTTQYGFQITNGYLDLNNTGGSGASLRCNSAGVFYMGNAAQGDLALYCQDNTNNSIILQANTGEKYVECNMGGSVDLYHHGTKKAETFSQGLLTPNNLGICFGDGGCKISGTAGSGSSAGIFFMTNSGGKWQIDGNGHFVPSTAGAVNIGSASAEIGNIFLADSKKVFLGSDQDTSIYHDGTHSYFTNTTGNIFITNSGYTYIDQNHFRIRNAAGNHMFDVNNSGTHQGVGLYYTAGSAGTEKLRTSATGITVKGEVAATQDYPNFRPTIDFNFAAEKKLDPRITYSRTGPASFINEFGKVVLVGDNSPRFDHDPTTRESKGLLIEESRTNIAPYSHDLSQFGGSNITKTANNAVAPDGTTTAAKIEHGGSGTSYLDHINTSISAQNAGNYTYSVWLKAPDDQPDGYYGCRIAILHSTGGNVEPTVSLNKTWTRYSVTKNFGASDGGNLRVHPVMFRASPGSTYDGKVIPSYVWAWGAQIEAGAFATSYIPTAGATRGGDVVKVDGEEFSEFYNPIESTILVDYTHDITSSQLGSDQRVYRFRAVGGSDTRIDYVSNSGYNPYIAKDGGAVASISHGQAHVFNGGVNRSAVRVKENSFAVSYNGSAVSGNALDTSGAWNPTNAITEVTLGSSNGGSALNGHMQRFMYYSTGLPNSQLVTLTS